MFKDILDPVLLNRILNALLLLLIGAFFWRWMEAFGLPMHIVLGVSAMVITYDLRNYSEDPEPRALLIGGFLLPFWLLLRRWVR